jgi:SAM-dependent methyltransferase
VGEPLGSMGRRTSATLGKAMRISDRSARAPVLVAALLLFASASARLSAADIGFLAPPGAPAEAFPPPQRPVAPIVSPSRSTEEHRDALDESGQLARLLDFKAGMTVGDIGAGSGYHTVRLAPIVAPTGRVIAQDVTRDYLIGLAKRTQRLGLTNIVFALGEPHDPRLPASSLDAAILVHMYHEVAQPYAFLYNLAPALKRGAPVGIVDLDRPTPQHGTPLELLRCELAAIGYRQVATHQLADDGGYLAVFSAPAAAGRKAPRDIVACGP